MAKAKLRFEARELRLKGLGIKTIASKLHVSSSTASLWVRDIELTNEQRKKLSQNARDPYYGKRAENIQKQRQIRLDTIKHLLNVGKKEVGKLHKRELFLCGVAIYWAEGFKKDNLVGFANTDSDMVKFFILWLGECCGIKRGDLKFRLGVNEQYKDKVSSIEKYWKDNLRVKSSQFQKPFFQKVTWKKIYDNPENYHGVLRVRVAKSTNLLRRIHGWMEGLRRHERVN